MNFKKINSVFKEKFLNLFMIDVAFAAIYLVFLFLVRSKIRGNLDALGLLAPQLEKLSALLKQSPENIGQLEGLVSQIGSLNTETLILFWSIPVMTVIFWCVFQGASWALLYKGKNIQLILKKFVIVSVIAFSLLFLFTSSTILSGVSVFEVEPYLFLFNLIAYFAVFYLLYVIYSKISDNRSLFDDFKISFVLSIRKIFVLGSLFIPMFVLLLSGIFVFFSIYTSKVIGIFDFANLWPWVIALVILIIVKIWYKVFFTSFVEKY